MFVGGAARLAGGLAGVPAMRADEGWELWLSSQPLLVTSACAATDFFLITAALFGWHFARRTGGAASFAIAAAGALVAAAPTTLAVNALRLIAVAHAHRWVIPRLPAAYDSFLHMLTGVAVFLPALIALNLILDYHGNHRSSPARA
jgi:exosortase/archaeosortase family protein